MILDNIHLIIKIKFIKIHLYAIYLMTNKKVTNNQLVMIHKLIIKITIKYNQI